MDNEKLNKLKEATIESIKANFKRDKQVFPVCIIVEPDGKTQFIGTPFRNLEEKKVMMGYVKDTCKKVNAIAVFIINEAWVRKTTPEQYKQFNEEFKRSGKRISEYDDKKEVAMMIFETKTSSTLFMFDIDRQKNELVNMISSPTGGGDFMHTLCEIQTNNN